MTCQDCNDCKQELINAIANTSFWLSADNWNELMAVIDEVFNRRKRECEKANYTIKISKVLPQSELNAISDEFTEYYSIGNDI